ncbi:unnamed protein product [Parajaminaea phylloscopi]
MRDEGRRVADAAGRFDLVVRVHELKDPRQLRYLIVAPEKSDLPARWKQWPKDPPFARFCVNLVREGLGLKRRRRLGGGRPAYDPETREPTLAALLAALLTSLCPAASSQQSQDFSVVDAAEEDDSDSDYEPSQVDDAPPSSP